MDMQAFKRYGSVVALGAACALGACGKSDKAADTATAAPATAMTPDSSAGTTATPADSAALAGTPATGTGAMSAANIASSIGLSNGLEIQAGKVAQEKATNADVKSFAKQMITDHQAMQKSLDSLTTAMNVTPQPQGTDTKKQSGDQMIATLNSTAKGAAFDKAYISGQVQAHQQTLNELQGFSANAPDPQLKTLIDAAIPKVQAHLDKAQQLQSKLGGA